MSPQSAFIRRTVPRSRACFSLRGTGRMLGVPLFVLGNALRNSAVVAVGANDVVEPEGGRRGSASTQDELSRGPASVELYRIDEVTADRFVLRCVQLN